MEDDIIVPHSHLLSFRLILEKLGRALFPFFSFLWMIDGASFILHSCVVLSSPGPKPLVPNPKKQKNQKRGLREAFKNNPHFFCDKCHKPGGGGLEIHLSKKNNHLSNSFSSHLEHF